MTSKKNNFSTQIIERASDSFSSYLSRVYNYMAGGLAVSGLVAFGVTKEPLLSLFYSINTTGQISYSLLGWISVFAPFILIFMISSQLQKLNIGSAQAMFWLFSAFMGASMGNIFLFYTNESIFQTFLISAASFLGLSIYGNTTSRDLSTWGRFFIQGLIGIIILGLANLYFKSSGINLIISIVGIFIFAGLTAHDTQRLRQIYQESDADDIREAKAISGALSLYLDFINLFLFLLSFFGDRKN